MSEPAISPSPWIVRWSHLLAPGAHVLDLACGSGRHTRWFHGRGHAVTAVDRDLDSARRASCPGTLLQADLENAPWPLMNESGPRQFDAVVVTNYLWRPLLPTIVASVAPGGVLLYETFADGNAEFGRPSRPDFLLQPGELLTTCRELHVIAYENGVLGQPRRCVQRIAAIRRSSAKEAPSPVVYTL